MTGEVRGRGVKPRCVVRGHDGGRRDGNYFPSLPDRRFDTFAFT